MSDVRLVLLAIVVGLTAWPLGAQQPAARAGAAAGLPRVPGRPGLPARPGAPRLPVRPGLPRVPVGAVPGTVLSAASTSTQQITGFAWTANNSPIPNATVRLRDVVSGRVVELTRADELGQFYFANPGTGTYMVELVGDRTVMAIGQAFFVTPGETVATFVRLPVRLPVAGLFSNSATAAVTQATSAGVTAAATPLPPALVPPAAASLAPASGGTPR